MYTVLLAESSTAKSSRMYSLLEEQFSSDCSIRKVGSRRELLQFLEHQRADIILLDADMPGITCHDLTLLLKNQESHSFILPIADLNTFEFRSQVNTDSIFDYLIKPFGDSELLLTMEETLELCRKDTRHNFSHCPSDFIGEGLTRTDIVKKKITLYIQNHYSEIISMQDVAQAMNYSDTHFCRLFKQCFHVNFTAYLNDFRINEAKRMLIGSNLTVKDVGFSCGYRDTSYFIRVFKRITGMTPSDYRIHRLTMTAKKSNKY